MTMKLAGKLLIKNLIQISKGIQVKSSIYSVGMPWKLLKLHFKIMYQNNPTFSWSDVLIQSESNLSAIMS